MVDKKLTVSLDNLKVYDVLLKDWVKEKSGKANTADLSEAAFSGSYNDLVDKPLFTIEETDDLYVDKVQKIYYSADVMSMNLEQGDYFLNPSYLYSVSVDNADPEVLTPYMVNGGTWILSVIGNPAAIPSYTPLAATDNNQPEDYIFGGIAQAGYILFGSKTEGQHTISITCTGDTVPGFSRAYLNPETNIAEHLTTQADRDQLLTTQSFTLVVNGVEKTAHGQLVILSADTASPECLFIIGNGNSYINLLKTVYPQMYGVEISVNDDYDETLDSDLNIGIMFNLTASNTEPITYTVNEYPTIVSSIPEEGTLKFGEGEVVTLSTEGWMDLFARVFPEPSLETWTHTFTTSSEYEWVKSIWVNNQYVKSLLSSTSESLDGDSEEPQTRKFKVTLDGVVYNLEPKAIDLPTINDIFDGVRFTIANKKIIGDENLQNPPFYVLGYDSSSGQQHFGELHLAEQFRDHAVSFSLEEITGEEVHPLDEKYLPDTIVKSSDLATVAISGSYTDLVDKPSIPVLPANVSAFMNDAGYLTSHQDISGKANTADLATVATSGSYNDLKDTPTIPVASTTIDSTDSGYVTAAQLYAIIQQLEQRISALEGN